MLNIIMIIDQHLLFTCSEQCHEVPMSDVKHVISCYCSA